MPGFLLESAIWLSLIHIWELVAKCKEECGEGWSKEYRQMDDEKVLENITEYMKMWMMIRQDGEMITILPSVGRITGYYPEDFKGGTTE